MTIKILFFGGVASKIGRREIELDLSGGASPEDVLDRLRSAHPSLQDQRLLFAVNEEYASVDTILQDGDELAIFTAVSGG